MSDGWILVLLILALIAGIIVTDSNSCIKSHVAIAWTATSPDGKAFIPTPQPIIVCDQEKK